MMKFVIHKTTDKGITILGIYDDKETAMQAGQKFYDATTERCHVVLTRANVDDEGNVDRSRYQFYHMWYF